MGKQLDNPPGNPDSTPDLKSTKPEKRSFSPHYLGAGPSVSGLQWIGIQLKRLRGRRAISEIAERAHLSEAGLIEAFEQGRFEVDLGKTRDVLRKGYGKSMTQIVADYYKAHAETFESKS